MVHSQPNGGSAYALAFIPLTPLVSTQSSTTNRLILVGNKVLAYRRPLIPEDSTMTQEQINKAIRRVYFIGSEKLWVSVRTRGLPKQMDTGRLQVYSFRYTTDGELILQTEEGEMTTRMVWMAPQMPYSDLCVFAVYILINGVRFERVMIDFYSSKNR